MPRTLLTPGQVLNQRYRIERLLGQGGFGAVYLAWDLNMDGPVAVKESAAVIAEGSAGEQPGSTAVAGAASDSQEKLADQRSAIRQFQLEAKILFQLRHPNLPRVTDYFSLVELAAVYLVMDYIEGEDLQVVLDRAGGPLPVERALAWITQVCDALNYLHTQSPPIIHRDIKPANIRITSSTSNPLGQAMLVDFGIAKIYDPTVNTTVGARAVTLNYSPPEQYGMGRTDAQSDVYALGATAYHMLTGRAPSPAVDVMSGIAPPPMDVHQANPQVSPAVSAVIAKAMQLNRTVRWQSAAEFRSALETAIKNPQAAIDSRPAPHSRPAAERPITGAPAARDSKETIFVQPSPGASFSQPDSLGRAAALPQASEEIAPPLYSEAPAVRPPSQPLSPHGRLRRLLAMRPWQRNAEKPLSRRGKIMIILASLFLCICCLIIIIKISDQETNNGIKPPTPLGLLTQAPAGAPRQTGEPAMAPPNGSSKEYPEGPNPSEEPQAARIEAGLRPINLETLVTSPERDAALRQISAWGNGVLDDIAWAPAWDGAQVQLVAVASSLGVYLYDAGSFQPIPLPDSAPLGGPGWTTSLAFSPDGQLLAAGGWGSRVFIWGMAGVRPDGCECPTLAVIEDIGTGINDLDFSPDGSQLAVAAGDGSVHVYQASGAPLYVLNISAGETLQTAFSPDGKVLVTSDMDGNLQFWNADPNAEKLPLQKMGIHFTADPDTHIHSLAFSPAMQDGSALLAGGSDDAAIYLWSFSTDALLEGEAVGDPLYVLYAHESSILNLSFSTDGSKLVSTSWDETLRLWEMQSLPETLDPRATYYSDGGSLLGVSFSPDGATAAGVTSGGNIIFWDVANEQIIETLSDFSTTPRSMAVSPTGDMLIVGMDNGAMAAASLPEGKIQWATFKQEERHYEGVYALAFSSDGYLLASGSNDNSVRIWNASDGEPLDLIETGEDVSDLAFLGNPRGGEDAPESNILAVGHWESPAQLWRVDKDSGWQKIADLGEQPSVSVAFSRDGRWLACGGVDGSLYIWDITGLQQGDETAVLSGEIAVLSDEIAVPSDEIALSYTLQGHTAAVRRLAFSPDEHLLASASIDGSLALWPISEAGFPDRPAAQRNPEDGELISLAFSPDNSLLFAGSEYAAISVWDTGRLIADGPDAELSDADAYLTGINASNGGILTIYLTPDSRLLIFASLDGAIRFWGIPEQ